ncbi:MAG: GGDEF domain-containing protein [Chitinispirillaceae bacterium]
MTIMDIPADLPATPGEETEIERLDGLVADNALTLDLVSALAGDRQLTESEKTLIDDFKKSRADKYYSDLLYAITHQFFPPAVAENLWNQLLKHKYEMSFTMKRNIRIAVAALDYLSNLTGELQSPTLIDETRMTAIVQLTLRDGLTRLFNHTTCYQRIEMELSRFERYGTIVSIMMIDIDNFKEINDRYGHVEGDRILAALAGAFKTETRDSDICCRYGGEEFVVIMPSTDIREAGILAERLRWKVEQGMPGGRKVTISIGVASCDRDIHTSKELVEKADAALYEAKRKGKNRVEVSVKAV